MKNKDQYKPLFTKLDYKRIAEYWHKHKRYKEFRMPKRWINKESKKDNNE